MTWFPGVIAVVETQALTERYQDVIVLHDWNEFMDHELLDLVIFLHIFKLTLNNSEQINK